MIGMVDCIIRSKLEMENKQGLRFLYMHAHPNYEHLWEFEWTVLALILMKSLARDAYIY